MIPLFVLSNQFNQNTMKTLQFTDSQLNIIYNSLSAYQTNIDSRKDNIKESHMKENAKQDYIQFLDSLINNINELKELVHIEEE